MSSQRTGSDILRLFMEEDIFADSAAGIHGQVMGKYVLWSSHHCWKSLYWPKKSSNGNTTIPLYDTVDGCEILHQLVTIGRYEHCLPSINYIYIWYIYIYIKSDFWTLNMASWLQLQLSAFSPWFTWLDQSGDMDLFPPTTYGMTGRPDGTC